MGRGSNKTLTQRISGIMRRAWSFRQVRLGSIAIMVIFTFLYLFYGLNSSSSSSSGSNMSLMATYRDPIQSEHQLTTNHRIACLIVADSYFLEHKTTKQRHNEAVQKLFDSLQIYDEYLSPYCDIKVFLVNTTKAHYTYISKALKLKLPHSDITFIPRNHAKHWKSRRIHTYHVLAYSLRYYSNYEWYLKFQDTDVLILVDHFKKLIYDKNNNNKYDMDKPQLLGHYIKDKCSDFIYSLTVYGFNQKFLLKIGEIAAKHLEKNNLKTENFMQCRSYKPCKHHTEDDFVGFCLKDLGINVGPTRDSKDREYFLIFQIRDHYVKMDEYKQDDWYWFGKNKESVATKCCADYPVVFANYGDPQLLLKDYKKIYAKTINPEQRNMKFLSTVRYFDDSSIELPPNVTLPYPRLLNDPRKKKQQQLMLQN